MEEYGLHAPVKSTQQIVIGYSYEVIAHICLLCSATVADRAIDMYIMQTQCINNYVVQTAFLCLIHE